MKYDLLIPAYNAEATIAELLRQIQLIQIQPSKLLVVDDGSTDHTFSILKQSGISSIRLEQNSGKGSALQNGLDFLRENSPSDLIICMDSDLQHLPANIISFLEQYEKTGVELIIGNRIGRGKSMPMARRLSNYLTSKILSYFSGQKLPDSQCGFRLVSKNLLDHINSKNNGFQFESQFILEAARLGYKIESVQIPTIYNNNRSNIHHLWDTVGFIKLILMEIWRRLWSMKIKDRK